MFPGVEDTLAKLANRPGTSLAVATSKLGAEYQEHIAAKFAFAKNFKTAVTFDDVKHGKPSRSTGTTQPNLSSTSPFWTPVK
ncbi:HAD hydrolase-like protein [Streptococcus thermophilus]|nr:HAD hydrolase-like protein [Streptococcus thermophilus]WCL61152.1 HAD hydrolase-like protein [Streptococcus thermophilus]